MKYLRGINETTIKSKEIFSKFINWDLINDAKELAIEFLDDGYTLSIKVGYQLNKYSHNGVIDIYRLSYSHYNDYNDWNLDVIYPNNLDMNKIVYEIFMNIEKEDLNNICDTLNRLHPEYKVEQPSGNDNRRFYKEL